MCLPTALPCLPLPALLTDPGPGQMEQDDSSCSKWFYYGTGFQMCEAGEIEPQARKLGVADRRHGRPEKRAVQGQFPGHPQARCQQVGPLALRDVDSWLCFLTIASWLPLLGWVHFSKANTTPLSPIPPGHRSLAISPRGFQGFPQCPSPNPLQQCLKGGGGVIPGSLIFCPSLLKTAPWQK